MNAIRVEKQNNRRNALVIFFVTFIALAGASILLGLYTFEIAPVVSLPANEIESRTGAILSASEALAADKPVLFVFTPADKCARQYCLNADIVQHKVAAELDNEVNVVDVPVYGFYIYTDGTPPSFIYADWDLYPVQPYNDWLPQAEMTEFGWGLAETHVVLVDEDGQLQHDFGSRLEMDVLDTYLGGS